MIYFIQEGEDGRIKIGFAADANKRRYNLQTGNSNTIIVRGVEEGGLDREAELHRQFAHLRVRGEWFSPAPELLRYVAACAPIEVERAPRGHERTRAHWNGKSAAEVSKETGVSPSYLSRILNEGKRTSPETAIAIQRATGVSAIKLVFGDLAAEAA